MNNDDHQSDALFTMMRFQVLAAALTPGVRDRLNDAYVFAWDELVYPLFHTSAKWHEPFSSQFLVSEEMIEELSKYLDKMSRSKTVPSFYELEDRYEIREETTAWDRSKLIDACRYMALQNLFDKEFWKEILKPMDHPSEASNITGAYNRDEDLYFH